MRTKTKILETLFALCLFGVLGGAVALAWVQMEREGALEDPLGVSTGDSPHPAEVRPLPLISIPPPADRFVGVRYEDGFVYEIIDDVTVEHARENGDLGIFEAIEAHAKNEMLHSRYAPTPENVRQWFEDFRVDPVYMAEFDFHKLAESEEYSRFAWAYVLAQAAQDLYVASFDDPSDGAAERSAALLEARKRYTRHQHLAFQRLLQADPVDVFNGSSPEEDFLSSLANYKESE